MEQLYIVSLIAAFLISFFIYLLIRINKHTTRDNVGPSSPATLIEEAKPSKKSKPQPKKKPQKQKASKSNPEHSFYLNGFKGFSSDITDFDIKGNYFGACCADGVLKIMKFNSMTDKDLPFIQGKLEGDQPTAVSITPNGSSLVTAGKYDRRLRLFNVHTADSKRVLKEAVKFPCYHTQKVTGICATSNFIISCGEEADTCVHFWNFSGDHLAVYDTKQLRNKHMAVSSDYKFLTVAAWIADARVIEISTDRATKEYAGFKQILDLHGHTQGLTAVAFSPDATQVATASKDLTIRLWRINVRYEVKEDPKLVGIIHLRDGRLPDAIGLGQKFVALGCGTSLRVYRKDNLESFEEVANANVGNIYKVVVYRFNEQDYVLTLGVDSRVNVWKVD